LPLVLFFYYLAGKAYRNYILLFSSLLFYGWGEGEMMVIMLASMTFNYLSGIWLNVTHQNNGRKWIIAISVITNIGMLVYFKYANLFCRQL